MAWRAEMFRWMTLDAAALKPDTDVRVHPETCHSSDAGPRPRLATNCTAKNQDSVPGHLQVNICVHLRRLKRLMEMTQGHMSA